MEDDDFNVVTVIHVWSAPRSRSTALLYSFEARNRGTDDGTTTTVEHHPYYDNNSTIALDEPLYATWLLQESKQQQTHTNVTRPYLPYIQQAATTTMMMMRNQNDTNSNSDHDDANDNNHHEKSETKEETFDATQLLQWQIELVPLATKLQTATDTLLCHPQECHHKVIFCKHMAKFWNVYDRERDEISEYHTTTSSTNSSNSSTTTTRDRIIRYQHYHVLLLRDPLDVVTSWNAIGTNVYGNMHSNANTDPNTTTTGGGGGGNTIHEIGMVPLLQIYSALHHNNNNNNGSSGTTATTNAVFVLDAEELIQDPQRTLQRLCQHCHVPYTNAMYVLPIENVFWEQTFDSDPRSHSDIPFVSKKTLFFNNES